MSLLIGAGCKGSLLELTLQISNHSVLFPA